MRAGRLFSYVPRVAIATMFLLAVMFGAPLAAAQEPAASPGSPAAHDAGPPRPNDAVTVEAGNHFRRGVQLYGEADYAGSLVEFKRAYALVPSSAALYNAGEAQYQLQDYAGALRTFLRFLNEYGPTERHGADVESSVEVLRGRVGHIGVITVPAGAEVSVDDQPAGKTPLDQRLLVSVGHRKVTAMLPGHAPATRFVDVAAGDDVSVTLDLLPLGSVAVPAAPPIHDRNAVPETKTSSRGPSALRTVGWVFTAAFAAGAASFGGLALRESGDLKMARNTFPASPATLQDESDRTRVYSILADSFTAAAIVVGAVTLWSTLTPSGSHGAETTARVDLTPSSVNFAATF
jgi:tetratricopeptide (TPR) repeat protein